MSLDIKRGPLSHMQAKKGPGPEVIKLFSTQLSMNLVLLIYLKLLIIANFSCLTLLSKKFSLLINMKMPTTVSMHVCTVWSGSMLPANRISGYCWIYQQKAFTAVCIWHTQPAFYINLQQAVIGPSATLTGRWQPAIDLCRMLPGYRPFLTLCMIGMLN